MAGIAEDEAARAALQAKKRRRRKQYKENCKARGKTVGKPKDNWSIVKEALGPASETAVSGDLEEVEKFLQDKEEEEEDWEIGNEEFEKKRKLRSIQAEAAATPLPESDDEPIEDVPVAINNDVSEIKTYPMCPMSPPRMEFDPESRNVPVENSDDELIVDEKEVPPSPPTTFHDHEENMRLHRLRMSIVQDTLNQFKADSEQPSSREPMNQNNNKPKVTQSKQSEVSQPKTAVAAHSAAARAHDVISGKRKSDRNRPSLPNKRAPTRPRLAAHASNYVRLPKTGKQTQNSLVRLNKDGAVGKLKTRRRRQTKARKTLREEGEDDDVYYHYHWTSPGRTPRNANKGEKTGEIGL